MRQRGGMTNYLMPFLIIICIGIIGVLVVGLWNAIFNNELKKAAYMHIISGSAQMKTWGTEEFFNISNDALIMQGDEIVTSADAQIIVEFFDGTIMRVAGNTDVNFVEINDDKKPMSVNLLLVNGKIWFNKLYRETGDTLISVRTSNLEIVSKQNNVFTVENGIDEAVRIFSGGTNDIVVNIFDKEGAKIVETETLGVGQEAVFSDAVLDRYWQFQSPSVIGAVNDEFKTTEWYLWNFAEDKNPTLFEKSVDGNTFVKVEPQTVVPVEEEAVVDGSVDEGGAEVTDAGDGSAIIEPVDPSAATGAPAASGVSASLSKPTFSDASGVKEVNSDGYYVVSVNPAVLKGGVPAGTASVVVNDFVLQKFKPGETTWTYFANASYGFMAEGPNNYKIYALDADGNKSEALLVKVLYKPAPAPAPVPEVPAETPAETPEVPASA